MKHIKIIVLVLLLAAFYLSSCKKFLDESPDKKLAVPTTLADCKALLRYYSVIVVGAAIDEASADNYYLLKADYDGLPYEGFKRAYTWQPDEIFDVRDNDWARQYRKIYYCNTVLTALPNIAVTSLNKTEWNTIKGEALFIRGNAFLQLVNIWAPAFDESKNDMGIPLRLSDDFNEPSVRASVTESYDQVTKDLKEAAALLPAQMQHPTIASKAAAFAYLSRAYLAMGKYEAAASYADSTLELKNDLLDYNLISPAPNFPFNQFNAEQIFHNVAGITHLVNDWMRIDTTLYKMYGLEDCRKTLFFKKFTDGSIAFKGNYNGVGSEHFCGMATDEIYLTRAECKARLGNLPHALADLNLLRKKRIKTAAYTDMVAPTAAAALDSILTERRKELPMRFVRWMDIKRLNRDGAGIVLKRKMNNIEYTLLPNDLRYALPLPEDIIQLSGMPQNPR